MSQEPSDSFARQQVNAENFCTDREELLRNTSHAQAIFELLPSIWSPGEGLIIKLLIYIAKQLETRS